MSKYTGLKPDRTTPPLLLSGVHPDPRWSIVDQPADLVIDDTMLAVRYALFNLYSLDETGDGSNEAREHARRVRQACHLLRCVLKKLG